MPRTNEPIEAPSGEIPGGFDEFARTLLISEVRVMTKRLQDTGEFQLPDVRLEDLDLRGLRYLKKELRETLRSLGGGR